MDDTKTRTYILLSSIFLLFLYLIYQLSSIDQSKEINLATGEIGSDSYAYGLSYKALLEAEGVKVNLVPTKGSLDTINTLNTKKAQIGFINSGVLRDKPQFQFESLAGVYYEPLWVFYRYEGYKQEYLVQAIGKNIGVSITNDSTYDLTNKLFKANGINENNTNFIYDIDKNGLDKLKNKEIDLFITLANERNPHIQKLLADPEIKLLSIKRAKAYIQKFNYLKHLTLNEGSIDLFKNIPEENIHLLSTTQNLVSNDEISNELIRILLKKVTLVHTQKSFFENGLEFPSLSNLDTPINGEAELYITHGDSWLEEIFPYWIASYIDRLKLLIIPLLWLLIPLFKSIVPLYIFTIRSKIFKWYEKLHSLELQLENADDNNIEAISKQIHDLDKDVKEKTKVPLSYMGEYYNLLVHLELIQKKLENKKDVINNNIKN